MEALRVGGLVSGLDTNSIIDSMMATAKEPINRMNNKVDLLTWEKTKYNDVLTALGDLKSSLLPLKMESTFKSKLATSTSTSVAEATAGIGTPPGSYTLKVDQAAEPSYAVSKYTSYAFVSIGAGVKGFGEGGSRYKYDQLEGIHNVSISNPSSNKWIATDSFTSKTGQEFSKQTGSDISSTMMDGNGKTTAPITNQKLALMYEYEGESKALTINLDFPVNTYAGTIARSIETQINEHLDATFAKDGSQHVSVKTEIDPTTGATKFAFYNVSNKNIEIMGAIDPDHVINNTPIDPTSPINQFAASLGIFILNSPVKTDTITNSVSSNSAANLATKINDTNGGLLQGVKLKFDTAGPKVGYFELNQDATANNKAASKSTFYGNTFNTIEALPSATRDEELEKLLNAKLNATKTIFDTKPSDKTNGYFHINGVRIDIYDYRTLSPKDLVGLINGSGAGVTASFDKENGIFKIENNKAGAGDVTLGKDGDTSNILSLMKVSIPSGSTYVRGKNEGTVDTSEKLSSANSGLSVPVGSGIFTVNGISIFVDATTDSIQDVMTKINKSGANVSMSYDSVTDKFTLRGNGVNRITIGGPNDTSNFLEAAGLTHNTKESLTIGSEGKKAIFTINGTKYERETNQVKDAIQDMTFTISDVGTTTINVKIDSDRAVEAMADFASKYNKIINMLTPTEPTRTDRSKYANPLTAEDKKTMSEDEVKAYEDNYNRIQYYDLVSKSSELRHLKINVRDNIMRELPLPDNKFTSLTSLGITMAGTKPVDITISKIGFLLDPSTDKEELTKFIKEQTSFASMVSDNADDVYKFFNENTEVKISNSTGKVITDPNSKEPFTKVAYDGWARRYDTFLVNNTSSTSALYKKAGTNGSLDTRITNLKKQIDVQTLRAEAFLERMWSQFSAMEQRVQNIQAQSSYLAQLSATK